MRALTAVVCFLLLMGAGRPAACAEVDDLLERAHAAEIAGDHARALAGYRAAHRQAPRFDTAASLGLAEARAGDAARAADHLGEALALFPPDGAPALRERLTRELAVLERKVAVVHVAAPAGARVTVAGRYLGLAPLARPIHLAAGVVRFEASLDGAAAGVERRLEPGTTARVELAPTAPAVLPYVLIGGGGALSIAAIALGAGLLAGAERRIEDANATRSALDGLGAAEPCATHAAACAALEEDARAGDDMRLAGAILLGGGGALLAGTIAYAVGLTVKEDGDTALAPLLAPGTAGLWLSGRF
jgi:tetratricopeptide (TPR) repeat protein